MSISLKIKLKFRQNVEEYFPIETEPYSLYILSFLLIVEMWSKMGFYHFYEWMKDSEWNETGGNLMFLKKSGNNGIIYFSDAEEKYEQDPEGYSLNIPLDQLIKLSEQWLEFKKILPPFIIITQEDNKYTMEASQE